jgi:hypothetical protein
VFWCLGGKDILPQNAKSSFLTNEAFSETALVNRGPEGQQEH